MRVFMFPAKYFSVVENALANVGAEIKRDQKIRAAADGDAEWEERVAPIPSAMLDAEQTGRIMVVLTSSEVEAKLGRPLSALAATG